MASIAALSRIQPLTTVLELEQAVANAQQAGRLLVVKAYAPWCSACKVIEPKYKRAASSNLEVDFCEIDFVQAKALCKHCGVEKLPTGMIFKDGKPAATKVGAVPKSQIVNWIESAI